MREIGAIVLLVSLTLSACQASPTPDSLEDPLALPPSDPVPLELINMWTLSQVVVEGTVNQARGSGQWISFLSDNTLVASDGCNGMWGDYAVSDEGDLSWFLGSTANECKAGVADERFNVMIVLVHAYEIRENELWLYTSDDRSSALVFR
jgi:heat shock protein HslJ